MSTETFAIRLKDLMETDGYNNTTLGKRLGISRKTIGRWLKEFYFPNYELLIKLARCFRVSTDYLLGEGKLISVYVSDDFDFLKVKKRFALKITNFLIKENLTENAFSDILGINHNCVPRWLNEVGMPEADTLIKLSKCMKVSVDFLLGIEE